MSTKVTVKVDNFSEEFSEGLQARLLGLATEHCLSISLVALFRVRMRAFLGDDGKGENCVKLHLDALTYTT